MAVTDFGLGQTKPGEVLSEIPNLELAEWEGSLSS
jgi:hypothetical protein